MSGLGGRIDTGDIVVDAGQARTPFSATLPIPDANTEQSITLPSRVKRYALRIRSGTASARFAYATGACADGGDYHSVRPGGVHEESGLDVLSPLTIYFTCSKANEILEITYWT